MAPTPPPLTGEKTHFLLLLFFTKNAKSLYDPFYLDEPWFSVFELLVHVQLG